MRGGEALQGYEKTRFCNAGPDLEIVRVKVKSHRLGCSSCSARASNLQVKLTVKRSPLISQRSDVRERQVNLKT